MKKQMNKNKNVVTLWLQCVSVWGDYLDLKIWKILFLLTSSSLASHLAAVMYRCTPEYVVTSLSGDDESNVTLDQSLQQHQKHCEVVCWPSAAKR